ncbi:ATP-binding protein [Sphingomonas sp.]|uniref:ATP-binding protein n=1 Tax=Sphingomonas sp. TaxID=28214 RepID=UPI0025FE1DC9|nr:ATP-binding protein [Sphingomonas sp.]
MTFAVVLIYIVLLLGVAHRADSKAARPGGSLKRGLSYALSLSVLCTSWTYFGAVGIAMRDGWRYLPNFLGPIIALTLLGPVWSRIAIASKRENISSVADFLASRYGKSRVLGALIAIVATIGALPYIALQILSLTKATAFIAGRTDPPFFVAPALIGVFAILAILFGARRPTLTQHNRGLSQIVSIEASVKLLALLLVAATAIGALSSRSLLDTIDLGKLGTPPRIDSQFIIATMLCTVTMFSLPRVFHLGFVTLSETSDVRIGRRLFPLYMAIWALAIAPIAAVGLTISPRDADLVVLAIPMHMSGRLVTEFAFLGGFSAGAAMVMVETIALSAMISNELILPWLARKRWIVEAESDVSRLIIKVRRIAIVAILILSYLFFVSLRSTTDLAHLGFTSLTASAQLVPAIIGGIFWRGGHARGAFWGIICGMVVWFFLLASPQLELGRFLISASRSDISGVFAIGICGSLLLNTFIYIVVSLRSEHRLVDRIQANAFVESRMTVSGRKDGELYCTIAELRALLQRFLGPVDTALGLRDIARDHGRLLADDESVTPAVARAAERMLAGAIGASSARNVIALALAGAERDASEVGLALDEAANAVQFNREIVHAALNGLDQGVSVVDDGLRIVAWNPRYLEIFHLAPGDIYVGKPLAELVHILSIRADEDARQRGRALAEEMGPTGRREPRMAELEWSDGTIIKVVGRPLSGGEYVTSFSEVTQVRAATRALGRMNEELEQRVALRTQELTDVNAALAAANAVATRVTNAQNRFVAFASHDLLQPLHAGRLFIATARGSLPKSSPTRPLLEQADISIETADRLLRALLNLSRIEVGGNRPEIGPVDLGGLLDALRGEYRPVAEQKGIELHVTRTNAWVTSNADLLRSVLQNLVGNAIRYTERGRVLVCVRPDGAGLRIEVRDSGRGIAADAQALVFREFTRLDEGEGVPAGTGLGLAIVERVCRALDHRLVLRSRPGQGSVFAVALGIATPDRSITPAMAAAGEIVGLRVLCIEDQPDVLHAQSTLLRQWGALVSEVRDVEGLRTLEGAFDLVTADYHLGHRDTGLDLLRALAPRATVRALLTANASDMLRDEAAAEGVMLLRKPVPPPALRSLLIHAAARRREAQTSSNAA